MDGILNAINDTPLPTIFVLAGIVFWVLAIAGSVAGKITVSPGSQKTAGLVGTVFVVLGLILNFAPTRNKPSSIGAGSKCRAGYVWRLATSEDHVCVTLETHTQVLSDNQLAGSRRNPAGGAYGPDTCVQGYVWRDAFQGDHVCVTPETHGQAAKDNNQAALRIR